MFKKILKLLKELKSIINNFELKLDLNVRRNNFLNLALTSNEPLIDDCLCGDSELIVSFTTYSKRIHDVHLVIESIGMQTLKPNRFILWLDEDEFTLDSIPLVLKKQMKRGLEVRFCPNYRSYKKLIPTLQNYSKANIITIDDDILYPYDMIELLYKEHLQYPNCVIGNRVHRMKLAKSGVLSPYNTWEHETSKTTESFDIAAIGIGGVFYPNGCFTSECLNVDRFNQLAPAADDIWFKAMSVLNGVKHKKVSDNRRFRSRFLSIDDGQDIALSISNVDNGGNDMQIKSVFDYYNLYHILK